MSPIPRQFFKYCGLSAPGFFGRFLALRRIARLLKRNEIYFASAASFNDPFDSKVHMDFSGTPVTAQQQAAILGDLQKDVNGLGMLCVSTKPDNILMWSHYALNHTGICLQFDAKVSLFKVVQPIAYSGPFPAVHATKSSRDEQMSGNLLTKASDWGYESEWRAFDFSGPGLKKFDPAVLSGIIFGCRTPSKDRDFVRRAAARGQCHPAFFEAIQRPGHFALDIVPA
jgi:hypothetical protein